MTTTTMPRSALHHRPIASDVEEFVVLSPRASRSKRHGEPHSTGGPPTLKKKHAVPAQTRQGHPLLLMGVGMLVTVLLLWIGLSVTAWVTMISDSLHYGYPRTTQLDRNVGHSQVHTTSHFTAINVDGQVYIFEIPGGKPSAAQLLVGPHLV